MLLWLRLLWLLLVWTPTRPPDAGPPLRKDRPKFSFCFFCLSLGVFSLNFGGVFEGRDPLGLSCETPAVLGWGFTRPNVHISGAGVSNTTKIQREETQRETQKERHWWREREKKREILGHLSGHQKVFVLLCFFFHLFFCFFLRERRKD